MKNVIINAGTHPNVFAWFELVGKFSPNVKNSWERNRKDAKKGQKVNEEEKIGQIKE